MTDPHTELNGTPAADVSIGFGGDGWTDTDWLGCHERSARERGQTLRADALAWMIATFDHTVALVPPEASADPDLLPHPRVNAGSYRVFEFAVAREQYRAQRAAIAHELTLIRDSGFTNSAATKPPPTHDKVTAEEIHACLSNFLGVTGYAVEFADATPQRRWVDTVPDTVPDELRRFAVAYLDTLRAAEMPGSHTEALQCYTRALSAVYSTRTDNFDAACGVAHAWRVVLNDCGFWRA